MISKEKENKLEYETLMRILDYNSETGVFKWKIDASRNAMCGSYAGCVNPKGYLQIRIHGYTYRAHRLAWFYVYKEWPNEQIDHKDRNKLNNKIDNLRISNSSLNAYNSNPRTGNTSGVKGVYYCTNTNRWKAWIWVKGAIKHLGCFIHKDLAIACRKEAELKYLEQI